MPELPPTTDELREAFLAIVHDEIPYERLKPAFRAPYQQYLREQVLSGKDVSLMKDPAAKAWITKRKGVPPSGGMEPEMVELPKVLRVDARTARAMMTPPAPSIGELRRFEGKEQAAAKASEAGKKEAAKAEQLGRMKAPIGGPLVAGALRTPARYLGMLTPTAMQNMPEETQAAMVESVPWLRAAAGLEKGAQESEATGMAGLPGAAFHLLGEAITDPQSWVGVKTGGALLKSRFPQSGRRMAEAAKRQRAESFLQPGQVATPTEMGEEAATRLREAVEGETERLTHARTIGPTERTAEEIAASIEARKAGAARLGKAGAQHVPGLQTARKSVGAIERELPKGVATKEAPQTVRQRLKTALEKAQEKAQAIAPSETTTREPTGLLDEFGQPLFRRAQTAVEGETAKPPATGRLYTQSQLQRVRRQVGADRQTRLDELVTKHDAQGGLSSGELDELASIETPPKTSKLRTATAGALDAASRLLKEERGQVDAKFGLAVSRSAAGGLGGAAVSSRVGDTPEERTKNAAIGFVAGMGLGAAAPQIIRLIQSAKPWEITPAIKPAALDRLSELIRTAAPVYKETVKLRHEEMSRRAGAIAGIYEKETGKTAFIKARAQLKGELPKAEFAAPELNMTNDEIQELYSYIGANPNLRPITKNATQGALGNVLAGIIPRPFEVRLLEEAFGTKFAKVVLGKRKPSVKATSLIGEVANAARSIVTSPDLSAPGRQGWLLAVRHPILAARAFKDQLRAFAREEVAQAIERTMLSDPKQALREQSGLELTGWTSHIPTEATEEATLGASLAERIPIFGRAIRASNRAYVTYLNKLRADVFDKWADIFSASGQTFDSNPEVYRGLARVINIASGRGTLPKALARDAPTLNALLMAPRYATSRIQALASPVTMWMAPKPVRRLIWQTQLATVGAGMSLLGLLKYGLGAEVELDPASTDFGKAKIGNIRLDFWAGEQQLVRYIWQTVTQARKTPMGIVKPFSEYPEGFKPTTLSMLGRWLQSKLAPVPSAIVEQLAGRTFTGDPTSWKQMFASHATPMVAQDIYDAVQEEGMRGLVLALPTIVGIGVQTYAADPLNQIMEAAQRGDANTILKRLHQLPDDKLLQLLMEPRVIADVNEDRFRTGKPVIPAKVVRQQIDRVVFSPLNRERFRRRILPEIQKQTANLLKRRELTAPSAGRGY